jgi:hypothetical protein
MTCTRCTKKHLSQALVLLDEYHQGYKEYWYRIIGHLAEACREADDVDLSSRIRREYQKMLNGKEPNIEGLLK